MPSYSNGGVVVDATEPIASAALNAEIGSITNVDIATNTEVIADDSGGLYDEGLSVTQIAPTATFSTKSISEVFEVVGVNGQCFTDDGGPGVIVYGKNRGDCLTDVAANDHSAYTYANGLMTLGTLTADKGADATISVIVNAIFDGTNIPLTINHAATLPGALVRAQFEIGLCAIAGVQFKPEGVTIDFAQQIEKPRALAPIIYPERIAVSKVQPTITFRGLDPRVILNIQAAAATHANTKVQLVKRLSGASYVAPGTPEHISFSAAGLVTKATPFSATAQGDATTSLSVRCLYDGTNAPIFIQNAIGYDATPET